VPLLCGSDSPEWFLVSGFSVHNELQAMVEAGLPPFAALETATVNPARYLGVDEQKGTIAVGKTADLLLLTANPLDDIANSRQIEGGFHQGKYYDRKTLDKLLKEARVLGKQ
jgi:imidazolonepropionase-like amidohydrolase